MNDKSINHPQLSDAYLLPFSSNRLFRQAPRLLNQANGMYYHDIHGRKILDGTAGLWCCNAGHGREEIKQAITEQLDTMDFGLSFQVAHPQVFSLADRLVRIAPDPLNHVFFTNSGSESVDTALKLVRHFWQLRGNSRRNKFIGRERGYHGVGFGGISVGGIENNRRGFDPLLPGCFHLPHTHLEENYFSSGMGKHGGDRLADSLESLIAQQGADSIAAVIIEPVAGSAGVIIPPVGYLQNIRDITKRHGILLIFDEVITGFGRVGEAFAASRWGIVPDVITCAKGLTNGVVPMGAVLFSSDIFETLQNQEAGQFEFFHGYTYSGHPLACAAAHATLSIYEDQKLLQRANDLEGQFADKLMSLRSHNCVTDIRAIGLMGAVDFNSSDLANKVFERAFWSGFLVRRTASTIALSPPLIINSGEITDLIDGLSAAIREEKI